MNMRPHQWAQFLTRAGPHHQQPRRVARDCGTQRDPLRRQVEVEQVGAHALLIAERRNSFKSMAHEAGGAGQCVSGQYLPAQYLPHMTNEWNSAHPRGG